MSAFTFQTRLNLSEESSSILDEYAALFSKVEHNLFKDLILKKDINDLKRTYLKKFQITARQFNSCRVQVEGKIDSIKEVMKLRLVSLTEQIKSLQKTVDKWKGAKEKLHGKKRRLAHLKNKVEQLKGDTEKGTIRLCFGGKKLFRSQFHLHENGYASHQEWKLDFDKQRKSEFFILGSKEETAGNQTCSALINEDGSLILRLRLPDALIKEKSKYIFIPNVRFKYGQEAIVSSLRSCLERKNCIDKTLGSAITYRLKKDRKGWVIFATTALIQPKKITKEGIGVFGVDINANHLAFAETDRFGNIINKGTISLNTYGKTKDQALAIIGDVASQIVSLAKDKPIVLEKLDFQKKKISLREEFNKKLSRMLSSFSYQKIVSMIQSRAWRMGVICHLVNPAFTSVIGLVKFAQRYGLSKHHAAAFCIGRRYLGYSEDPPKASCVIPDGRNSRVTLPLPARNQGKHVWVFWGVVKQKIKVALAAHFQTIHGRSSDPPLKRASAR